MVLALVAISSLQNEKQEGGKRARVYTCNVSLERRGISPSLVASYASTRKSFHPATTFLERELIAGVKLYRS